MRASKDPKSHKETTQKLERLKIRMEEKSWKTVQKLSTPLKPKQEKKGKVTVVKTEVKQRNLAGGTPSKLCPILEN